VRASNICFSDSDELHRECTRLKNGVVQTRLEDILFYPKSTISVDRETYLGSGYALEFGAMMRKPGNIWVDHTAINQLLYIHCTCRIDDVFAHLSLVCQDGPIVEYDTCSIEGVAERRRIKEVCDRGGYVRSVHEYFLKAHPGGISMRNKANGWRPRKRKEGVDNIGIGARRRRDNYNSHGSIRRTHGSADRLNFIERKDRYDERLMKVSGCDNENDIDQPRWPMSACPNSANLDKTEAPLCLAC
jgi:hypothetical protein